MRTLADFLDQREPALPLLRSWIDDPAGNGGILPLPADPLRTDTLVHLEITTRYLLGTLDYETGGESVGDGLVRPCRPEGRGSDARRATKPAGIAPIVPGPSATRMW